MEEAIKVCDLFPVDPKPNVKGKQCVSQLASLIFSPLIVAATIWISFANISSLWTAVSDLPITSGIGSTQNISFSPFIIVPVYFDEQDKQTIKVLYKSSMSELETIICPENLLNKIEKELLHCYITKPIMIGSKEQIFFFKNKDEVRLDKVLIEKFSLDTQIENKEPYLFQNVFHSSLFNFIEVSPIKISIYDSLISQTPSKQNIGINSYSNIYQTYNDSQLFGSISFSEAVTCLEYSINRDSFLLILAAVTSWFQSISGVVAIFVIFNSLALKRLIGSQIFCSSRLFKNKFAFFKLYVFSILDMIYLGTLINNKFGYFKNQAIVSEDIDKKSSLEYIFRIIMKKQQSQQNNIVKITDFGFENNNDHSQEQSAKNNGHEKIDFKVQCEYLDLSKAKVQKISSDTVGNLLPQQSDGLISNIMQKLNMNTIDVSLSVSHTEKSSKVSVFILIIGIVSVSVLLFYFGAFEANSLRQSKYIIRQTNSIQMGKQDTMIYAILFDRSLRQVYINQQNQTIFFAKMDKNYNIIEKYMPKKNCTAMNSQGVQINYNYCLETIVSLQSNQILTQRFVVFVTKLYSQYQLVVSYKTAQITYDNMFITVKQNWMSLFNKLRQEVFIRKTNFKSPQADMKQFPQILFSRDDVDGICPFSPICAVFTLLRQQYSLTLVQDTNYYMFQNVWSTTYLLFSFLIVFLILPYNNKISKTNMLQRINSAQNINNKNILLTQKHQKMFEISNIILLLESTSALNKISYVKTNLVQ